MTRMTGGQAVVEQLEREGVDRAFGIAGVHTLSIYDALIESEIEHVTTRHEQGAGFMADGYARATGRVGVALLITGPGLTNAATPIGQAYSDSSPMLVISSANETNEADRGKGLLHELKDQQGVMDAIAAYSQHVDRVRDVPDAIADAFEYLDTHRPRPVHIQIPTDVLEREEPVEIVDREPASPPAPDEDRIAEAVERLDAADRPLLIVGGGAAGAAAEIRRLVDATGIPVASTTAGKGVVPETHDLHVGSSLRRDELAEYADSRDVVLAVGTELSPQELRGVDLPENLIHVDIDYANFGKNYPADLGIVSDARAAVAELARRIEEDGVDYGDAVREEAAAVRPRSIHETADEDDRHRVLSVLRDALDEDAIVVNDMTKLCYEARGTFPALEPDTFLFPRGFGTLGFAPPAAVGAAFGVEDRQVVGLVGDGGFLFTVQSLATAVKYDVGVPIVILNDDSYDVLADAQRGLYGRVTETDIANPDFVEMARTFGAAAILVEFDRVEEGLPAALDAAFDRDQPTIIEIPVDF